MKFEFHGLLIAWLLLIAIIMMSSEPTSSTIPPRLALNTSQHLIPPLPTSNATDDAIIMIPPQPKIVGPPPPPTAIVLPFPPHRKRKHIKQDLSNFGPGWGSLLRSPQGIPIFVLPKFLPKDVEVLFVCDFDGGLNNQRSSMLEGLMLAKLWGIQKIRSSPVLLKLTNMLGVGVGHRYKPPYDNINVVQGPVWTIAKGEIGELFDREHFEGVLKKHGMEWVTGTHPSVIAYQERWRIQVKLTQWPRYPYSSRITSYVNHTCNATTGRCLSLEIEAQAMEPAPANVRYVVLELNGAGLLQGIPMCKLIPECFSLLDAFQPSKKLVPMVRRIIQTINRTRTTTSSYVAFMWREFDCHYTQERGIQATDNLLLYFGEKGIPKETPIYVCTTDTVYARFKEDLKRVGLRPMNKFDGFPEGSLRFQDVPFEVWAYVDFEVAKAATHVVSSHLSTWVDFLNLYRMKDGRPNVDRRLWGCNGD